MGVKVGGWSLMLHPQAGPGVKCKWRMSKEESHWVWLPCNFSRSCGEMVGIYKGRWCLMFNV